MRQEIRQYFIFTKQEKRAVMVLSAFIIIMLILPYVVNRAEPDETPIDEKTLSQIQEFKQSYESQLANSSYDNSYKKEAAAVTLFYFDPNTIGVAEWMKLGLSQKQAEVIERYKSKGGRFWKPEDIRKIFVISDEKKEELLPYVAIADSRGNNDFGKRDFNLKPEKKKYELFDFDPNKIGLADWVKLGLSEKQATTIENYKAKGGKFRKPEDIRKIFVLSDEKKEELLPYVVTGETPPIAKEKAQFEKSDIKERIVYERPKIIVDINLADSAGFEKLYGIGPKLASRIVQYREWLGGFYTIDQIREVYGLPDSTFQKLKPDLRISAIELKKIAINSADYNTLKKHPYTRNLAYRIVKYRDSNTPFKTKEHICRIPEMTDELCRKLQRYIVLE